MKRNIYCPKCGEKLKKWKKDVWFYCPCCLWDTSPKHGGYTLLAAKIWW